MRIFDEEKKQYGLTEEESKQLADGRITNLAGLMKTTIALHDIGKGIALEKFGNSEKQHVYTNPLLEHAMQELGYTAEEVKFAHSVVSEDPLGDLIKGVTNLDDTFALIKSLAEKANTPIGVYYKLLTHFCLADCLFYKSCLRNTFKRDERTQKYIPQKPIPCSDWHELEAKILHEDSPRN
ncbi:hypothetical protein DdX_18720 [Ditylenchus destructor]|uniref:HD domain-containing protein n=1 Tax=Ditylenchus destructor TaxID=166010 RepID=A0AAD4MK67_9BILA|nr:hypothetical protein DdX_18720 [Ditylenchus destructor]